jgi:hypothetical protein
MFSKVRSSLFTPSRIVVFLGCILTCSVIATATCPTNRGKAKWRWNIIYYTYDGAGDPNLIADAASVWSDDVSSITSINPAGPFNDIQMHDGMLDTGVYALTDVMGEDTIFTCDPPGTSGRLDNNLQYCYNAGMAAFSTMTFDQNHISQFAAAHGVSPDSEMFHRVVTHEFGHVFSLTDVSEDPPVCSGNVTLMNYLSTGSNVSPYTGCNTSTPQTCDVSEVVNSIYSGWSTYTWDGGCNTSTSC